MYVCMYVCTSLLCRIVPDKRIDFITLSPCLALLLQHHLHLLLLLLLLPFPPSLPPPHPLINCSCANSDRSLRHSPTSSSNPPTTTINVRPIALVPCCPWPSLPHQPAGWPVTRTHSNTQSQLSARPVPSLSCCINKVWTAARFPQTFSSVTLHTWPPYPRPTALTAIAVAFILRLHYRLEYITATSTATEFLLKTVQRAQFFVDLRQQTAQKATSAGRRKLVERALRLDDKTSSTTNHTFNITYTHHLYYSLYRRHASPIRSLFR